MSCESQRSCPICNTSLPDNNISKYFLCPRCGDYTIDGNLHPQVSNLRRQLDEENSHSVHLRSRLSHLIRCSNKSSDGYVHINPNNLETWRLDDPLPSVMEQAESLIIWTGRNQQSPEKEAKDTKYALSAIIGASTDLNNPHLNSGLSWIVENLNAQGLILFRPPSAGDTIYNASGCSIPLPKISLQLTFLGWYRYGELMRGHVKSRTAFMAMKFDLDVEKVVNDYFKPAAAKAGFDLRMLSDGQPAGLIDDQMRVALRRSKFVVADLTHGNQGAYWEAGFAEGLGRPVIYTCRKKEWKKNKTHFDTNHLVTIIWDPSDLGEASQKLTDTIRSTLPAESQQGDSV